MDYLSKLELSLDKMFKGAPKLPKNVKDWIVKYLPWINVVAIILTIWSAWVVWHWAHTVNTFINYANQISQAFGGDTVSTNRLSVGIWIGLIVLIVEAVIYILAYSGLKAKKKAGWNYLFLASLVNVVYGIVIAFTNYGGVGNLIGSLIGTVIGWYFLFQIREYYLGKKIEEPKPAAAE
jgi:hypothetical protein